MFEHAQRVYAQMREEASYNEELKQFVYEGHLTQLFKKLLLSVPYYTAIKNRLAGMGCIEQIRRGGGNGTSRWVLWKEPELEEWKLAEVKRPRQGNKTMILEQRIKDMSDRMRQIEQTLELIQERLR
jgi:hypothetical protein